MPFKPPTVPRLLTISLRPIVDEKDSALTYFADLASNYLETMPLIAYLLLAATSVGRLALADEITCWAPDGKTQADNDTVVPCNKLGIQQEGVYSSCCRLDGDLSQRDYCTTSGLCLSTLDGVLRRGYCTDKTWKSAACVNVCIDPNTGGSRNDTVEMTACSDGTGTYCCGRNELGCCGTDHAIAIPTQASVVSSGGAPQPPGSSSNAFKSATIGLAVVLGVLLATSAGVITYLLSQNKSIKRKLSEKTEETSHVPPSVVIHPYTDSRGVESPPMKDSLSPPGSPGSELGNYVDIHRYSELDATLAPSRSEMGSPVQQHFDHGEASPGAINSQLHQPHSPYTTS
ncbi:hypothetical protein F5Y14DRAFT_417482 [Nemania sp. NC0429]|nr:hypothetical protein F5Y14DRAFT_417482 [Nemania sp. NC0429]